MSGTEQVVCLSPGGAGQLSEVYDAARDAYLRIQVPPAIEGLKGAGTIAVLDTGVLPGHPDIGPRLADAVDMTGQGIRDEIGHGTKVMLVLVSQAPGVRLVSVKVMGTGANQPAWLVDGLDHVAARDDVTIVNVSAGIYRPDCFGHCAVCEAARRVVASGKLVVVAAGNLPGITACPAKASDAVLTVAAIDPDTDSIAAYPSPATPDGVSMPTPVVTSSRWTDRNGVPQTV